MDRYLPPLSERSKRWARFAGVLAAGLASLWILLRLQAVLTPVAAGLAIAYILNPLITWLERARVAPRTTSIIVLLVLLAFAAACIGVFLIVQAIELASSLDDYTRRFFDWSRKSGFEPESWPASLIGVSTSQPADVFEFAKTHGLTIGKTALGYLRTAFASVGSFLTLCALGPAFAFVFLLRFNEIVASVHDHLPTRTRPTIVRVVTTIDRSMSNFFRGRLLVCSCVAALLGFGWMLVGVPHNWLLGALGGLLNLVPFLSILSLPPALLLTYASAGENWAMPVTLTFVVYAAVQAIESFALSPIIEARAAGLHPLTTVIVLMIGSEVGGLLGMLLSIPLASTLKSLGAEYLLPEIRRLAAPAVSNGAAAPATGPPEGPHGPPPDFSAAPQAPSAPQNGGGGSNDESSER